MKAYGHKKTAPVDCCPGHSHWIVQSKHGTRTRTPRAVSRRPFKKAARQHAKRELASAED